jgi:alpha-N-arabinofuranosidase
MTGRTGVGPRTISTRLPRSAPGTSAISVNSSAWSAVSFWHSPQNANAFVSFSFWIHGGTSGGQALQVYAEKDGVGLPGVTIPAPAAGTWQQVTLSLDSLGLTGATNMTRFNIFNVSGNTLPTFYLDDISLISDITPPVVQSISPAAGTISYLRPHRDRQLSPNPSPAWIQA